MEEMKKDLPVYTRRSHEKEKIKGKEKKIGYQALMGIESIWMEGCETTLKTGLREAYQKIQRTAEGEITNKSAAALFTAASKVYGSLSRTVRKQGVRQAMLLVAQMGKTYRWSRECARCSSKYFYKQSRCSKCNRVWYCGKNCQRMHWLEGHAQVCKQKKEDDGSVEKEEETTEEECWG